MKFNKTKIPDVFIVDPTPIQDERGFFARFFCKLEFESIGIDFKIIQINNSFSPRAKTLRGLHYQTAPFGEDKYLRCINGLILDIIVDLRVGSPSFGEVVMEELSSSNRKSIFVPKGCAHGFLTLVPNTEVLYAVSQVYSKDHERVLRWNDPMIKEKLPIVPDVLSNKDRCAPDYLDSTHATGYTLQMKKS